MTIQKPKVLRCRCRNGMFRQVSWLQDFSVPLMLVRIENLTEGNNRERLFSQTYLSMGPLPLSFLPSLLLLSFPPSFVQKNNLLESTLERVVFMNFLLPFPDLFQPRKYEIFVDGLICRVFFSEQLDKNTLGFSTWKA